MQHRMRTRMIEICASLLACAVFTGCGDGNGDGNGNGNANGTPGATATAAASAQSDPLTLVVQMTGLMLVVPPKQANGLTHVLMPGVPDHLTWLGFKGDSTSMCEKYDGKREICYVDMNGYALDSLGQGAGSGGGGNTSARGPLNLSRGTGRKVNLSQVTPDLASQISLERGSVTDSCGVGQWTFNPIGQEPPGKIELMNVLEWQIPNLIADSIVLFRRHMSSGTRERIAKLRTSDNVNNEIELFVMHVLPADTVSLFLERKTQQPDAARPIQSAEARTAATRPDSTIQRANAHFAALYNLVRVPADSQRLPRRPVRVRGVCPITVLDLHDQDISEISWTGQKGTKTFSCVMASAEQS